MSYPIFNPAYGLKGTLDVFVDKSGNDTFGTGSPENPYLTIVKALSTITDSSTTLRYAIRIGAGRFDEVSNIIMKPYTYLVGQGRGATRITVTSGTPLITINAACATGIQRVGFFNFLVSGNTNMSFPLQTLNPSIAANAFTFELNSVTHNNDIKWKGRAFTDLMDWHDGEFFQLNPGGIAIPMEFTVPSGTWKSCQFYAGGSPTINFNDTGRLGSLSANMAIYDTNIDNNATIVNTVPDAIPAFLFFIYRSAPAQISITGAGPATPITIDMDDASIPQVQNITLINGTITRLTGTSAINYTTAPTLIAHAGGGQALATPITTDYSIFTIVALAGDSGIIPSGLKYNGQVGIKVKNIGANSMNIFPQPGQQIDALGVNNPYALASGASVEFIATSAIQWSSFMP